MSEPVPRRKRRRHHRPSLITLLVYALVIVAVLALAAAVFSRLFRPFDAQSAAEATATLAPSEAPSPTVTPSPTPEPTPAPPYDFSSPVPQSDPVEKSYLDGAVFLGDSRTEGLVLYTGLSNSISYAHKGLNVSTIYSDDLVEQNGQAVTVMEAMKNTQFDKVYIMFGINELGWSYPDIFIQKYTQIIQDIRAINSDAIIYVQEILPVSQKVSDTHDYITNQKIQEFNQMLATMAQDQKVYYLQVSQCVVEGDNFCLPDQASSDGIHLTPDACQKWLTYLLCHVVTP